MGFFSFLRRKATVSPVPSNTSVFSTASSTPVISISPAAGFACNGSQRTDGTSSSLPEDGSELDVYDGNGVRLHLGEREYCASGGEGAVYTLPYNQKILIKIYKKETLCEARKMNTIRNRIMDMTRDSFLPGKNWLAWPLMPIFNENREVIGFAMRKSTGRSLLSLRGPANIRKFFPAWNRRTLVKVALDFIQKVKILSDHGVLINDFNPANFLVNDAGQISFIDCDSFQVPSSAGGQHITRTFFPSYSAPELLNNKPLLGQPRNIHQTEFGAAMIVFHILMCGLHPYAYYDPDQKSDCGMPDENLLKGRCPFGLGAGCMMPPGNWYNLWSHLTCSLKNAFIMTFRDGHANPEARATLDHLEAELQKMLHVMDMDPVREDLIPQTAKPHAKTFHMPSKGGNRQPFGYYMGNINV